MIVVYPVRQPPDPTRHEDLRYSMRSLRYIDHTEVVIVGYAPDWVDRTMVTVIEVEQSPKVAEKWHNIGANLRAAVDYVGNERFLWMNQDVFFARRLFEVPAWCRRMRMQQFSNALRLSRTDEEHNGFVQGIRAQTKIARAWGVDVLTTPCLDSHFPLPMRGDLARAMLDRLDAEYPRHPAGHFKNLYTAYIDRPMIPARDPKVMTGQAIHKGVSVVSTSPTSWQGRPGAQVRARFRYRSAYETVRQVV